jgi:hypothetical protein
MTISTLRRNFLRWLATYDLCSNFNVFFFYEGPKEERFLQLLDFLRARLGEADNQLSKKYIGVARSTEPTQRYIFPLVVCRFKDYSHVVLAGRGASPRVSWKSGGMSTSIGFTASHKFFVL